MTGSDSSVDRDTDHNTFLSKVRTALNTSANKLSVSFEAGSNMMKSAVSVMRSPDMGFGLGPKTFADSPR